MGRILKVRSGRPIPTKDMGATFHMMKLAKPAKVAKVVKECTVLVDDLFWQGWVTHLDDTNWEIDPDESGSEFWDGEKWDSGVYGTIFLQVIGTWAEGFRPTRCRVSVLTTGPTNIYIYCATGGQGSYSGIMGDGIYEFPISIRENNCDIYELKLWGPVANFYVTNIEFYPGEFNVKSDITEYVEQVWDSYFDNSYWEDFCSEPSWDGAKWITHNGWPFCARIFLEVIGSWFIGYRPTKMRLELSQLTGEYDFIQLMDSDSNIIGEVHNSYVQMSDIPLDFSGTGDIDKLRILFAGSCNGPHNCTRVEFL